MAGEWVKMRVNLVAHPKVQKMAEAMLADERFRQWSALTIGLVTQSDAERYAALRVTRYVTVTALLRFWGYAHEHVKDEKVECASREVIEEIAGVPGFAGALEAVGWAVFTSSQGVDLPGFSEHNTTIEERKTAAAERQKRYRERRKSDVTRDVTRDVTVTEREEKRREDIPPTPKGIGEGRFQAFWDCWPKTERKADRKKCLAKWQRLKLDAEAETIIAHVEAMKGTRQWRDGYEPAPLTYLNGERWRDGDPAAPGSDRADMFAGAM